LDVTARRLGWTQADGLPEYVSGELVILDAGAGREQAAEYAVHLVDGYAVDPESLVAVQWAELRPAVPD
jgi:hypothetical protein